MNQLAEIHLLRAAALVAEMRVNASAGDNANAKGGWCYDHQDVHNKLLNMMEGELSEAEKIMNPPKAKGPVIIEAVGGAPVTFTPADDTEVSFDDPDHTATPASVPVGTEPLDGAESPEMRVAVALHELYRDFPGTKICSDGRLYLTAVAHSSCEYAALRVRKAGFCPEPLYRFFNHTPFRNHSNPMVLSKLP